MAKNKRTLADIVGRPAEDEPAPVAVAAPIAAGDDDRPTVVSTNIYMTKRDRHRLNQLALDTDSSVQRIVREAIDAALIARGLPPLEPATANTPSGMRRGR